VCQHALETSSLTNSSGAMRTDFQRTHLLHRKAFYSPADPGARELFETKLPVYLLLGSSNPYNVPQLPHALAQYAVHILRF
jgi:hypothetical protein